MALKPNSNSKEHVVTIVIDSSVREDIIKELHDRGVMPDIKSIKPIHFKVSEEIGGFIKTVHEFYESLKENTFFENAEFLRKQFVRPLLILEEDDTLGLDRNCLIETWATLFVQFNIPIIRSQNVKDTAKLLLTILRREKNNKPTRVATKTTKAPTSLPELQKYILKRIPGISDELARRLLTHFKTLENLVNAQPEKFMEVKGIGRRLAEKLHAVFV